MEQIWPKCDPADIENYPTSTEPIRPGRKFECNHKVNKRVHYMNYEPCR
jgi:hypothetical protein